jgi:transposase
MSAPRRYELTDFEWSIISPLLPDKPRGVPRVDDRKVINGIYRRLRTGSPWADIPKRYGPSTTCYNRFVRWRKLGVWERIFNAVSKAYDVSARRRHGPYLLGRRFGDVTTEQQLLKPSSRAQCANEYFSSALLNCDARSDYRELLLA